MVTTKKIVWGCGHHSFYDAKEMQGKTEEELQEWAKERVCSVCYRSLVRNAKKKKKAHTATG